MLAGLVCLIGIYGSFAVAGHASRSSGAGRRNWALVSVVASGCTAWATHFIVLLAFRPGVDAGFDPLLTALSLFFAIVGIGAGVWIAIRSRTRTRLFLAGLVVGVGVALLHYVGQSAYLVRGAVSWNVGMVVASVLVSFPLFGAAMVMSGDRKRSMRRAAAPLLVLSIAVLHFCGMAAMTIRPDAAVPLPSGAVSPTTVTPIVAGICLSLVALAVLGWRFSIAATARIRADRQRLQVLADVALEGLLLAEGDVIVTANDSLQRLSGLALDALAGGPVSALLPGTDLAGMPEKEEREAELVGADGRSIPVRVLRSVVPLGHRLQTVVAVRDQRERLQTEAEMRTLAFGDALTGLPNRTRFFDLLAAHVGSRRPRERDFAVLMIDLDRFKPVNDTLGHAAGDTVLRQVAERLSASVREGDVVARLGGDEFAILQVRDANHGGIALAERIVAAVSSSPFLIGAQAVHLGTSVGVSFGAGEADDPAEIMRNADLALYAAKADGRGTVRCYDVSFDETVRDRQSLEQSLRRAIVEGGLDLHYQPLVDARSRRVTSAEALLRWHHPERGPILPAEFIPLAEETGLILPLGAWVLRTACAEAAGWPQEIGVAINLSPAQFRDPELANVIMSALAESRLHPSRLELEITEGVLLDDQPRTVELLADLRAAGIRISLDDFGTGYSSLGYLRQFRFDKIKIDQSFIRRAPADLESVALIRAIVTMSACFGIPTTMEGVETTEQFDFAVAEGCDTIQGYHVSRPLTAAAFAQRLQDGARQAAA